MSKWSETFGDTSGSSGNSKAIERLKNRDYGGSLYMVNKPPRWNDQVRFTIMETRALYDFKRVYGPVTTATEATIIITAQPGHAILIFQ